MKHISLNKKLSITILLLYIGSNFICCKREHNLNAENTDSSIDIPLEWKIDDDFVFNEIYYTQFPVYTEQKAFPKIYNRKIEHYRNIPRMGSSVLVTASLQYFPIYFDKYNNGYRTKEGLIEAYKIYLKDTVYLKSNPQLKYQLNAFSGFSNDMQIVVPDLNNNGDFGDDPRLTFPKEFTKTYASEISHWDTLPLLDFSHQVLISGKIFDIKRKILLYPRAEHRHVYLLIQGTLDESLNSYTLMMELKDYAKGHFNLDSVSYTTAVQGRSFEYPAIAIKPDSVVYPSSNTVLQSLFTHSLKDTIMLGNHWFKIDSLIPDFSSLILKKVNAKPKNVSELQYKGHIDNRWLIGLDGKKFELFKDTENVQMTFVEFWGTWCGPCVALTPEIIKFHNEFGDKIRFISVAYDKDIAKVKTYVNENKLDWEHSYINESNTKNTIIDDWKIQGFPTFILIDEKQQMYYGGNGNEDLEYIKKLLKEKVVNN